MIGNRYSRPSFWAGILSLLALADVCALSSPDAVEGEVVAKPGVTLQWVSDHRRIAVGETLTLGLLIQHEENFHTYWRSPGIVGLAPMMKWKLPEGISVGPIRWPGPEVTKMGQLTAWGYERDVLLTTRITVSPDFTGEVLPLEADLSWMACADTCHPGWATLSLEIPIGPNLINESKAELFRRAESELPQDIPADWRFRLERVAGPDSDWTVAHLDSPETLDASGVVFFCGDNQVNSDLPQIVTSTADGLELRFPASEVAPKDVVDFEGVLYHPKGWPGLTSRWLRVRAERE